MLTCSKTNEDKKKKIETSMYWCSPSDFNTSSIVAGTVGCEIDFGTSNVEMSEESTKKK